MVVNRAHEEKLSKTKVMDTFLNENEINSSAVYHVVKHVFGFDLDMTPVLPEVAKASEQLSPKEIMESRLNQLDQKETGAGVRRVINEIFGVNLDAIAALEGKRISLYSKGKWVVQHDQDLFVVHTGDGDVDVTIYPTAYFQQQTGLTHLPMELAEALKGIGYYYVQQREGYYYSTGSAEAVPDAFKGQTMGMIMDVIHKKFSHL